MLFTNGRLDRANLAFFHDVLIAGASLGVALYLRVGEWMWTYHWDTLVIATPVFMVISAVCFRAMGMYRGVWRYASTPDLLAIMKAVTVAVLVFVVAMFLVNRLANLPRSVPIIQWFVLITMLGGPRFFYRMIRDQRRLRMAASTAGDVAHRTRLLLIGAGDEAEIFIRALTNTSDAPYAVVGLLDESGRRRGRSIHGVPVLGSVSELNAIVARLKKNNRAPQRLVITDTDRWRGGTALRELMETAAGLRLPVSRMPRVTEFQAASGMAKFNLKPVAIEDLLGRPQVALDRALIAELIEGKRVLVTGAGGTIGTELCHQIAALSPDCLIIAELSEYGLYQVDLSVRERDVKCAVEPVLCDVRDRASVDRLMRDFRPDIVFHAAALKHVPIVERHPELGVLTNVIGTRNVADAALASAVQAMVLISTDKAVNPSNVMGATKKLAETYCQALDLVGRQTDAENASSGSGEAQGRTRFVTVRFGNVLGSSGSVIPLFQRQLERGGPITVTDPNIKRYFMTVAEAVELVLQASAHGLAEGDSRGRIHVLEMGEPVRIIDVARQMVRLAGLKPDADVEIRITGLRPGDKLYEELFAHDETPIPTSAPGVRMAAPRTMELAMLARVIDELESLARKGESREIVSRVASVVPGYQVPIEPDETAPSNVQQFKPKG